MAKRKARSTRTATSRGAAAGQAGGAPARPTAGASERAAAGAAAGTLPRWVPPVVYAAVTVLLFREFFFGGTSMLGVDSLALSYFARDFYTEFVQAFRRMPHWNPLLYGGLPFVEGMHGDIFYPPSLALFFLDARAMWGWKMALHIFLAGVFTYLWLRRGLRLDRLPAFFGGLVYMMGADLVSLVYPGGDGKLFVSALAPLVFWLAERAVRGRRLSDFAVFALGISLLVFTSHMQAAYFCIWGVSLYFLFRLVQLWRAERDPGAAGRLLALYALAGVLGVAAAAVQFLPPLEYLREHSHRAEKTEPAEGGYAYSTSYSLNPEEIGSLVVPEFAGDQVREGASYWGRNPLKLNSEYAGFVALLLIPVLLLGRRRALSWFFIGLAVLTLLYALGANTPVFRLFYLVPGVRLFRAPSIIIFLYGFSVATLGALAVQRLQTWLLSAPGHAGGHMGTGRSRSGRDRAGASDGAGAEAAGRYLWIAAAVLGGLALLASAGVLTDIWTATVYRSIDAARLQALQANMPQIQLGFWLVFALALVVAGGWALAARGALTVRAFLLLLTLLAGLDLYRFGRPFVAATASMNRHAAADAALFHPSDAISALQRLQDAGGVFRVFDAGVYPGFMANVLAVHGLEQLGGHHGNELGRYRNLIGGDVPQNLDPAEPRLLDVTNTEYLLLPGRIQDPRFEEVYAGMNAAVYRYRNALPRAYLVGRTEVVPDRDAVARLLSPDFDRRGTALLPEPLPAGTELAEGAGGTVEWLEREVDRHRLRVVADRPALLMVLDNHYPAWQATVNGRHVPIHRANYTFRAVPVPAGDHEVIFRYEPSALRAGATISLAVLALLLGVIGIGAVRGYRAGRATA